LPHDRLQRVAAFLAHARRERVEVLESNELFVVRRGDGSYAAVFNFAKLVDVPRLPPTGGDFRWTFSPGDMRRAFKSVTAAVSPTAPEIRLDVDEDPSALSLSVSDFGGNRRGSDGLPATVAVSRSYAPHAMPSLWCKPSVLAKLLSVATGDEVSLDITVKPRGAMVVYRAASSSPFVVGVRMSMIAPTPPENEP
jgi:hypothetical protein